VLDIATEKVQYIITLARDFDAKVAPWESSEEREDDIEAILEDSPNDPYAAQLKTFIDELNVDEQVSLVAIMWIGRGTYEAGDLEEALSTARAERVNETSDYLLGVPLLADYLTDGLEKLGIEIEE
jgi:hypothetical protein